MKTDRITQEVWEDAENAFLEELKAQGIDAERAKLEYDVKYHTDIWVNKNVLPYSVDVKNFSFEFGLFGFYFAKSHSQWGNSQAERLRADKGKEIAGEYIAVTYVKDGKPVWAIIDRSTLLKRLLEMIPINLFKVEEGNPNSNWKLREGLIQPRPNIWWYKEQAPSCGEEVEKRWGIHVNREVFERLVLYYKDRSMLIKSPSGGIR